MLRTAPTDIRPDFRVELRLTALARRAETAIAAVIASEPRIRSGWPSLLEAETFVPHGPGIAVHLALSPSPLSARLVLWLEAPLAIFFVERLLGSVASGAAAHQSLNLRAAEQGVLAYAAAKVAQQFAAVRVTDVSADFPALQPGVLVPFSVEAGPLKAVALGLWFGGDGAQAPAHFASELQCWLNEDLDDAELSALASGDLLCFQHGGLREHGGRLWGPVLTSFQGCDDVECALIEGSSLVRHAASPAKSEGRIRIELGRQSVGFDELAHFGSDQRIALRLATHELSLSKDGAIFATGEFVRYRQQLAIRISAR
jgi:hypothetical protein